MNNFNFSWYAIYLITLFLFDISPGVSFVMTAKNTIKNKSLIIGLFTAFGIATSDGISAIIGYFFCSVLEKYSTAFKIAQLIGMSYLLFVGSKMLFLKSSQISMEQVNTSKNKFEAYKSGFLVTFCNIGIATIIISVISQFYKYVNTGIGYFGLLITIPIVSFFTFLLVAVCVYCLKLWKIFEKYNWLIDKIAGVILITLGILNIIEIL